MTVSKQPMPPADVIAAITRAEALLKAARPLLKAKRVDWHNVQQVMRMASSEISEPSSTILHWDLDRMREERERAE